MLFLSYEFGFKTWGYTDNYFMTYLANKACDDGDVEEVFSAFIGDC